MILSLASHRIMMMMMAMTTMMMTTMMMMMMMVVVVVVVTMQGWVSGVAVAVAAGRHGKMNRKLAHPGHLSNSHQHARQAPLRLWNGGHGVRRTLSSYGNKLVSFVSEEQVQYLQTDHGSRDIRGSLKPSL